MENNKGTIYVSETLGGCLMVVCGGGVAMGIKDWLWYSKVS